MYQVTNNVWPEAETDMIIFSKELQFGVSTLRYLYESRMKKPTPPPIPDERGLCINNNNSRIYIAQN